MVLKIQASSGNCPVSSLQTYVCVRPTVPGPLFVFADKSVVSASHFSDVLRRCVQAAGLPIHSYKPHSFRFRFRLILFCQHTTFSNSNVYKKMK